MGIGENWNLFIQTTKAKSKTHMKAACYWHRVNNVLSLTMIFLASSTTFLALLKPVPSLVVAGLAALSMLVSTVAAFLRAGDHSQVQAQASTEFKTLMMKMVCCEEEIEYECLWRDYNRAIMDAPILPKKWVTNEDIKWTITPELLLLIKEKEEEVKTMVNGIEKRDSMAESITLSTKDVYFVLKNNCKDYKDDSELTVTDKLLDK